MAFESASGVVLNRRIAGEGDLYLTLFLKGLGIVHVSARGAAKGKVRFGGATEPMVWGAFSLYSSRDEGGKRYLKSVDVADDMLGLRTRPKALFAAARWAGLLTRSLMEGHGDDDLLGNLYWNMKLLCGAMPAEAVEWRFMWRWLTSWGVAPDISECVHGLREELELLRFVASAKRADLETFEHKEAFERLGRLFSDAARRAETFLHLF